MTWKMKWHIVVSCWPTSEDICDSTHHLKWALGNCPLPQLVRLFSLYHWMHHFLFLHCRLLYLKVCMCNTIYVRCVDIVQTIQDVNALLWETVSLGRTNDSRGQTVSCVFKTTVRQFISTRRPGSCSHISSYPGGQAETGNLRPPPDYSDSSRM